MKDRAISLNAVIDALHQSINLFEAEDRIRDLPPVKPQLKTEWIPVSERLPETYKKVLATTSTKEPNVVITMLVPEAYIFDAEEKGRYNWRFEKGDIWFDYITAWMPLPTPYEPQESEDKG